MKMNNYTHVGNRSHVGHVHSGSRLHGHRIPKAGRTHALTGGPVCFVSLCGEKVTADVHDEYGFRIEGGPRNVKPAEDLEVTCKRCLRLVAQ
jgi:hypothetical protein